MAVSTKHNGFKRLVGSSLSELAIYSKGYKRVELGNIALTTEGAVTAAVLFGAGTTTTRSTIGTANKNFIGFWLESSATSGDARGAYLRLYLSGAGGSGESARLFTTVAGVVAGGAHGAHITASMDATGSVTGLLAGVRATLAMTAATRTPAGTYTALQCDSDIGDGNTVPAASTSFIRFADNTSTQAAARVPNLFDLANISDGAAGLFSAHTTQTMTHSIMIKYEGVSYYLMCTNAATNRT